MVTPTDEASLAAGVAGVQAVLGEHGQRFDRIDTKLDHQDDKLDAVIGRIDVLYPELAALKQQVAEHERRLGELANLMKGMIGGTLAIVAAFIGDFLLTHHW